MVQKMRIVWGLKYSLATLISEIRGISQIVTTLVDLRKYPITCNNILSRTGVPENHNVDWLLKLQFC